MKITVKRKHRILQAAYFAYRHTWRSGRPWHEIIPAFLDGLTVYDGWTEFLGLLMLVVIALVGFFKN